MKPKSIKKWATLRENLGNYQFSLLIHFKSLSRLKVIRNSKKEIRNIEINKNGMLSFKYDISIYQSIYWFLGKTKTIFITASRFMISPLFDIFGRFLIYRPICYLIYQPIFPIFIKWIRFSLTVSHNVIYFFILVLY